MLCKMYSHTRFGHLTGRRCNMFPIYRACTQEWTNETAVTIIISQLVLLFNFNAFQLTIRLQICMCFFPVTIEIHKMALAGLYFRLHIEPLDVFTGRPGITFEVCGRLKYTKHVNLHTYFKRLNLYHISWIKKWAFEGRMHGAVWRIVFVHQRSWLAEFSCWVLSRAYVVVHTVYPPSLSVRYWQCISSRMR